MATAIPKACLSSAIRCRDVETGPNLVRSWRQVFLSNVLPPVPPSLQAVSVGSIPPFQQELVRALRLLAAHPPALRCLRPAVPSEHLEICAFSDAQAATFEPVPAPRRSL